LTEQAAPAAEVPEPAAPAEPATLLSAESAPAAETPATEAKPAEGEKPAEEPKPTGAPEKYELQAPEGKEFDANSLAALESVARELNLDNASTQKIIDKIAPALAEKQAAAVERASAEWVSQVKADKEIGGDKLNDSLVAARTALDQFGTAELRGLLDTSRLGNHPEVVKFMARVGQAISPDSKFIGGKPAPAGAKDPSAVLYDKS